METNTTVSHRLTSVIESLLLVSEKPISMSRFEEVLSEFSRQQIEEALGELRQRCEAESSGMEVIEVGGGYQFRTKSENAPWIFKLNQSRPTRLSRASLETLSIIAYRQPVTKPEIEEIRGVDSGQVVRHLLELNLIRILGKREDPGHPLIYGTTPDFLSFFGLRNLADLPSLREYSELGEESQMKLAKLFPPQAQPTEDESEDSNPPERDEEGTEPAIEHEA